MRRSRWMIGLVGAMLALAGAATADARQPAGGRQSVPLTVLTPDGRRPLAGLAAGDQVMVWLDDLVPIFQLTLREDATSNGVAVGYRGRSVLLTAGQALASAGGRLVSLPAPVAHEGRRWLVPLEFISRGLGAISDTRLDVRKRARLVLVGDVRVPRIGIRQETIGQQCRVTLDVAPRTPHAITQDGSHIVVRFDADALDVTSAVAASTLVQAVRVQEAATSIVIDTTPRAGSYRSSATPQEPNATQIAIDVLPAGGEPSGTFPTRVAPAAPAAPALEPPVPQMAPASGLRAIVLDPGHGGHDTGARGPAGTLEKDLTLTLARRLRTAIEARLGVRVLLTRDGDETVPLDDRAAVANNNKADLFISLHANASVRPEVMGAQVYYLAGDQSGDEARKSAASRQVLPALGGGTREIELILWEMAQMRFLTESAALAGTMEEQFRGRVRLNLHPVQQAPFRVLAGANMPAVLIEVGFLTNPEEEQHLTSEGYQATVTQAILDGLVRFREATGRADPTPAASGPPSRIRRQERP